MLTLYILYQGNRARSCQSCSGSNKWHVQVKADVYEKIDKELLEMVEDVLLNRCDNATERMLDYAATLDPKSKPTDVRKKGQVNCWNCLALTQAINIASL